MKTENLTTKEKAEELVRKYYTFGLNNTAQSFSWYECKECAKISVDETLELLYSLKLGNALSEEIEFYEQVKHEIVTI
jgi:hypothetical protein